MVVLMKVFKPKKLIALLMALVMLVGTAAPVFAADEAEEAALLAAPAGATAGEADDLGTSLTEINNEFTLVSYESYKTKYGYSADGRTGESVTVKGTDYMTDDLTAQVENKTWEGVECAYIGDTGSISWKADIPAKSPFLRAVASILTTLWHFGPTVRCVRLLRAFPRLSASWPVVSLSQPGLSLRDQQPSSGLWFHCHTRGSSPPSNSSLVQTLSPPQGARLTVSDSTGLVSSPIMGQPSTQVTG